MAIPTNKAPGLSGNPKAVADKTAVAVYKALGIDPYAMKSLTETIEQDRMRRTFPINNKWHFINNSNHEAREKILKSVKEGDVKGSPVDIELLRRYKVLYPPEENSYFRDIRLKNFKQKFYRNNPNWQAEEKEWERRKEEAGFEELSNNL